MRRRDRSRSPQPCCMTFSRSPALALANEVSGQREHPMVAAPAPRYARRRGSANNVREDFMERIPQPIMDKRGEPHMKRFEDQRWVLDNIVRSNGIDWDQPRSIYISGPCGMEGQA